MSLISRIRNNYLFLLFLNKHIYFMNAKETLKKIAEALNIVDEQPQEENPVVEQAEEAAEPQVEQVEEVAAEEPAEEPKADEVVEEPVAEEPQAEEQPEESKEDPRVAALEQQLADLKEILKNAFTEPVEEKLPEPPVKEEPKGLTHSPEKQVKPMANGIGNKGGDMMSRVFKYINN